MENHSVCVLLMGMLFCTAGCAATEQNPSANHTKATDLPPLVTDTSEETTDAEPEETVSVTETTPAEALYKAKAAAVENAGGAGNTPDCSHL